MGSSSASGGAVGACSRRTLAKTAPTPAAQREPRRHPVRQSVQHVRRVLPPVELEGAAQEGAGEDLQLRDLVHAHIVRPGAERVPPHFSRKRAEMQTEAAHETPHSTI